MLLRLAERAHTKPESSHSDLEVNDRLASDNLPVCWQSVADSVAVVDDYVVAAAAAVVVVVIVVVAVVGKGSIVMRSVFAEADDCCDWSKTGFDLKELSITYVIQRN